jgi:DNA-binding NarL/FixJ family response regulator
MRSTWKPGRSGTPARLLAALGREAGASAYLRRSNELLREGLTTGQVAKRLFISPGTVRVHVSSVLKKLQTTDRAQALRMLDER